MADEVLVARPHADATLAAAPLIAIGGNRRPLDVAGVADGDRHVFFGDEIFDTDLAGLTLNDLRAAGVAVLRLYVLQLVDDDLHQQPVARQNRAKALDRLQQLGQLVDNLLPFQAGQTLELHVKNRLRLDLRQAELHHQPFAGFGHRFRPTNQLDDRVEMINRDLEALEYVIASLRLLELEFGPAPNHVAAEFDE